MTLTIALNLLLPFALGKGMPLPIFVIYRWSPVQ